MRCGLHDDLPNACTVNNPGVALHSDRDATAPHLDLEGPL